MQMTVFLKLLITFGVLALFSAVLVFGIVRLYRGTDNVVPMSIVRFVGLTAFVGVGSTFGFIVTLLCRLWSVL